MLDFSKEKLITKEDKIKNKIQNLDVKKLIEESINIGNETNNRNKLEDDKENLLELLYNQTIDNYLNYVKGNTIQDGKKFLKKELKLHNEKLRAILIKSDAEIDEYKTKYLNILKENSALKEKMKQIEQINKRLMHEINEIEINSENFKIQMQRISQQKIFFDKLFEIYPDKSQEQILKYLEDLKLGSIQILYDYQNILERLKLVNNEQKEQEKEFKLNMNKLYLNNETLIREKNDLTEQYSYKIGNFDQLKKINEKQNKKIIYLSNTLFHIYNLLFTEFGINRNLVIDKKYLDIKESDFDVNIYYDEEIKNYIELMIKSMHHITYDSLFRETVGYLNMILRVYLPKKMHLRFQPIKAFKEIKEFIDSKITKIEDDQNIIKALENKIEKQESEINKIKREQKELNKEYNLYKNLVEKEFIKTNKIIFHLKNGNSENDIHKTESNIKNNKTRNIRTFSSKFPLDRYNNINELNKIKKKRKGKIFKREEIKTYKVSHSQAHTKQNINPKYYGLGFLKPNKTFRERENTETIKIKKGKNNDKIIKDNGNQQSLEQYNKIKLLIDETNRLFLYKTRMNSIIDKESNEDKGEHVEKKENAEYYKTGGNGWDSEENIKNKIFNKINHLLATSYKKNK